MHFWRIEVISKPIFGVILNQPREPLFSRRAGGLSNHLIIPLNHPLGKGGLKLPCPTLNWLKEHIHGLRQVLQYVLGILAWGNTGVSGYWVK
jgi:hypothetical protein